MLEIIDREDHQKLYMQLYEILRKKIENNEWSVGSQIPTEDDLCKIFNISRATVRTAILELVRQGYLKRLQGKGTFVYRNIGSEGLPMLTSLKELMFEEMSDLSLRVLAKTVMMPVDDLSRELDIQQDKHIIYIKRLWTEENKPVIFQESYIPHHLCPLLIEDDIVHNSLFDLLEKKYGIKITRIKNYIDITLLKIEECKLLGIPEGSDGLALTQHIYSGNTEAMFARSVNVSKQFKFFIDLERKVV